MGCWGEGIGRGPAVNGHTRGVLEGTTSIGGSAESESQGRGLAGVFELRSSGKGMLVAGRQREC